MDGGNSKSFGEWNLQGIVKGPKEELIDAKILIECKRENNKPNLKIGFALSNSELNQFDLEKTLKEIWDDSSKLFAAETLNVKFSLKLQLF